MFFVTGERVPRWNQIIWTIAQVGPFALQSASFLLKQNQQKRHWPSPQNVALLGGHPLSKDAYPTREYGESAIVD